MFEDPDGAGPLPEAQVGGDLSGTGTTYSLAGQLLPQRVNASYRLRACDANGCGAFTPTVTPDLTKAIGYFKASNASSMFGSSVALSADGGTMAVGAEDERVFVADSNGNPTTATSSNSGAVYVFVRAADNRWSQQARLNAGYTGAAVQRNIARFGSSLALSSDGNTLAVGAPGESSNARGVNGDPTNMATPDAGAVYVFERGGAAWSQQAYVKSTNTPPAAKVFDITSTGARNPYRFGSSVSLSADGNLLAVGTPGESGDMVGSDQTSSNAWNVGAVYTYARDKAAGKGSWAPRDYLKADSTPNSSFGKDLALSGDGMTLAVAGSKAYVFAQAGKGWSPQSLAETSLGSAAPSRIALASDGNTLALSALVYSSDSEPRSRIALVFTRSQGAWSEQAALKLRRSKDNLASFALALSADGNTLAVGDDRQAGSGTGLASDPDDDIADGAGAVFLFQRSANNWNQRSFIKASNTDRADQFGRSVALSANGSTLAAGAPGEDSKATGIQGDQGDNSAAFIGSNFNLSWGNAGAVYLY
ncbi:MAG: integrin [Proteobacteria bacterium]|nr:integrin [Pseudomonadota bacterium]